MSINYSDAAEVSVAAAIDLYKRSTLGERRPVDRPDIFAGMLKNADITLTAWDGDRLVGICRTLTDFTYVAYVADLAVDAAYQRQVFSQPRLSSVAPLGWYSQPIQPA